MLAMPSAAAVLDVWETAQREHPVDRALTLLQAFSGEPRDALASLGVHRRDALLVQSRMLAFGRSLEAVGRCAQCPCDVEIELELPQAADELPEGGTLTIGGDSVAYRAPNSYDLAAAAAASDAADATTLLRTRCVCADLSDEDSAAADRALETLCSPSAIEIAAVCPACGARFAPLVDIGEILWREFSAYARRLLDDVDALATKYGWSEPDILALSDARRQCYIEGAW